ncbi:hypothetical protein ACS0TY_021560 [Phlomoides rotata]
MYPLETPLRNRESEGVSTGFYAKRQSKSPVEKGGWEPIQSDNLFKEATNVSGGRVGPSTSGSN